LAGMETCTGWQSHEHLTRTGNLHPPHPAQHSFSLTRSNAGNPILSENHKFQHLQIARYIEEMHILDHSNRQHGYFLGSGFVINNFAVNFNRSSLFVIRLG
jgi:hypothetical protein